MVTNQRLHDLDGAFAIAWWHGPSRSLRLIRDILKRECNVATDIVSIDGVQLKEFDFVDIGEMIRPTNVVPLVIKSLLFSGPGLK